MKSLPVAIFILLASTSLCWGQRVYDDRGFFLGRVHNDKYYDNAGLLMGMVQNDTLYDGLGRYFGITPSPAWTAACYMIARAAWWGELKGHGSTTETTDTLRERKASDTGRPYYSSFFCGNSQEKRNHRPPQIKSG